MKRILFILAMMLCSQVHAHAADIWVDVDTALSEVNVNKYPLTDDTDFKSQETSIAYNESGMALYWHFSTTGASWTATQVTPTTGGDYDWAHQNGGIYTIEIPASGGASINNDTEGFGYFTGKCNGVLSWIGLVYGFRKASMNNVMVDGGTTQDNMEDAFDGSTGYGFTACTMPTVTTLTGHTAQTGDSYAIVNSGTYGNAQLVRATTPANSLDVNASGEAGVDLDNTSGTLAKTTDITGFNDLSTTQVNTECDTALTDYDPPTNTEMEARTIAAANYFDPSSDTVANVTTTANLTTNNDKTGYALSASGIDAFWDEVITGHSTADSFGKVFDDEIDGLRTYGDSNWGSSGENPNVLLNAEINTVTDQTHFTLATGSTDDSAYDDQSIVIYDDSNSDYPSVRVITSYTGATKTVVIDAAPDFTMGTDDSVRIFVTAPGSSAPTVGQIQAELEEDEASFLDDIKDDITNVTYGLSALETLVDDLETRLTSARAGYLDNLNGHTPQTGDTYSQLPTNFSDLSITVTTGAVNADRIEGTDATDQLDAHDGNPPSASAIQAEMEENGASILDDISDKLPTNYIMGSSDQTDKDDEIDASHLKLLRAPF